MHTSTLSRPVADRVFALGAAGALAFAVASPAAANGVRAGTMIRNTATASYDAGAGATATITSNTVEFRVDEVLDVTVAARDSAEAQVAPAAAGQVRSFTVTNAGNGNEGFRLAATGAVGGNGFDPQVTGLYLDSNGNGQYDPGVDQQVASDGSISPLDPDAVVTVFVLSTVPAGAGDGQHGAVRLSAAALTGSGAPGTAFAGQGSGGGDAIVGATHADAQAAGGFVIARATVALVKSATVLDPFGGTRAMPGSLVTYRLAASIGGSGAIAGLHVTDTIPTGTHYKPGTLTLDGAALSDAVDGDAGTASASGVDASLGTQAAGQSHAVQFTVIID